MVRLNKSNVEKWLSEHHVMALMATSSSGAADLAFAAFMAPPSTGAAALAFAAFMATFLAAFAGAAFFFWTGPADLAFAAFMAPPLTGAAALAFAAFSLTAFLAAPLTGAVAFMATSLVGDDCGAGCESLLVLTGCDRIFADPEASIASILAR